MLKKIIICTDKQDLKRELERTFNDLEIIKLEILNVSEFSECKDFDVIQYYLTFMEEFGSKPLIHDCQILETNGRYNFPPYVVTSPVFKSKDNLTDIERTEIQIKTPLIKVIEFSKNIKKDLVYAIHTDISVYYSKLNEKNLRYIKSIYENILRRYKLI